MRARCRQTKRKDSVKERVLDGNSVRFALLHEDALVLGYARSNWWCVAFYLGNMERQYRTLDSHEMATPRSRNSTYNKGDEWRFAIQFVDFKASQADIRHRTLLSILVSLDIEEEFNVIAEQCLNEKGVLCGSTDTALKVNNYINWDNSHSARGGYITFGDLRKLKKQLNYE